MLKYATEKFDLDNDEILWENFMCFIRKIIPYEATIFNTLSEKQKIVITAFNYSSEVMGDGHMSFFELYGKYISFSDVIAALKEISVSDKYIKILEDIPTDVEVDVDSFDEFDARFYQYGDEELIDRIIRYIRQYHLEFFEYV